MEGVGGWEVQGVTPGVGLENLGAAVWSWSLGWPWTEEELLGVQGTEFLKPSPKLLNHWLFADCRTSPGNIRILPEDFCISGLHVAPRCYLVER